jgi:hypothetical protein
MIEPIKGTKSLCASFSLKLMEEINSFVVRKFDARMSQAHVCPLIIPFIMNMLTIGTFYHEVYFIITKEKKI